jgi:hypothetical protein
MYVLTLFRFELSIARHIRYLTCRRDPVEYLLKSEFYKEN